MPKPSPRRRQHEAFTFSRRPVCSPGEAGVNGVIARWRQWWLSRRRTDAQPDPAFAYRIGWMKDVRTWEAVRRAAVADALRPILAAPDFVPNEYDRRYRVLGLDDGLHAGASLVALQQVLQAFELNPS